MIGSDISAISAKGFPVKTSSIAPHQELLGMENCFLWQFAVI
jgi:hypothetical protein